MSEDNALEHIEGSPAWRGLGEMPTPGEVIFRALIDNALDLVAVLDANAIIRFQSPSVETILGYTVEEMVGRNALAFLHPDDVPLVADALNDAIHNPRLARAAEFRIRHRDGSWRLLEARGKSLLDDPAVGGVVINARDITERKKAEEERARLIQEKAARAEAEAGRSIAEAARQVAERERHAAERERHTAEIARRRAALLSESSALLGSSLDYETTLESFTHLIVPFFADWCTIDLLESDGHLRRLGAAHRDPSRTDYLRALRRRNSLHSGMAHPLIETIQQGQLRSLHLDEDSLAANNGMPFEFEKELDELGTASLLLVPLTARGRGIGVLACARHQSSPAYDAEEANLAEDMARRAALAIDNARLFAEVEKANNAKDEFLAVLSHELRTPLTSILGWVYLLRADRPDEVIYARALKIIESNARAQERLIEDLIDVSRILAGKLRLEMRPLDLSPVLAMAAEAERANAAAKDIRLDMALSPGVGRVLGDEIRLRQAVSNLLSNAVKFTPDGGRVELRLETAGPYARIVVRDSGQGIAPDMLPRIFERFQQADSSTARRQGGLGLGLTIVRHVVEMHHGRVSAQSEGLGLGACFVIEIPLIKAVVATEGDQKLLPGTGRDEADEGAAGEPASPLEGLKILLVDDEADVLELVDTILSRAGALIKTADSARQGFSILTEWHPDFIISDLAMPGEDGLALMRRIRNLPESEGGRVVSLALTGFARPEDRTAALSAGFDGYVSKPVEPSRLIEVVTELVRKAHGG